MLNCCAASRLRSISTLMMVALSPNLSFASFKIGAIILQGPHHSAEKSTSTGFSELITSWKLAITFLFYTTQAVPNLLWYDILETLLYAG